MEQSRDNGCCSSCHLILHQPYIACKTCKTPENICLECFSKGKEFQKHKKTHRYAIIHENFSVLEPKWTASEEIILLDSLIQKGEGNWEDISKGLNNKSAADCKIHYETQYLDNELFPSIPVNSCDRQDQPVIFAPSDDLESVLRPVKTSNLHKELAGYNAARGDFDWESDNLAEMELNGIDVNGDDLYQYLDLDIEYCDSTTTDDLNLLAALTSTALQVYNQRLRKRVKRKRMVREFGLLHKSRASALPRRHPFTNSSGAKYEHLFKMGPRIMCAFDFDFVLTGMENELGLRQQILRLQDYRNNGISHPLSAAFYSKLKSQREQDLIDRPKETILDYIRSAKTKAGIIKANPLMTMTTRRAAGPLDIVGLPSYEKLNEEERDVCSEARVFPEVFLEIKKTFVEECSKSNGLRLADARPLVKIDVNKTRKLYDFLLKKELIFPPN